MLNMNDFPTEKGFRYIKGGVGLDLFGRMKEFDTTITVPVLDIKELFRYDPVGLEKYQERRRGIEYRLDKVIRRNRERRC